MTPSADNSKTEQPDWWDNLAQPEWWKRHNVKWWLRGIGILIAAIILLLGGPNGTKAYKSCAFVWLRAGAVTSLVISSVVYIIILIFGVVRFKGKARFGALLAVIVPLLIILFPMKYVFSDTVTDANIVNTFHKATKWLVIIAFFVLAVDIFLLANESWPNKEGAILLDVVIASAALVTYLVGIYYSKSFAGEDALALGFKSGAIAFEIIIANLIFEPEILLRQLPVK